MPHIIERSDTITIANLSIKVSHKLGQDLSPAVQSSLKRLSPKGIERLLLLPEDNRTAFFSKKSDAEEVATPELINLGLVTVGPISSDLSNTSGFSFDMTETGVQTRRFLWSVITEFIEGLKEADEKKPN